MRRRVIVTLLAGVFLLGCAVGLAWYLRSPQFANLVREKVTSAIENATGGRVELGSFHWNVSRLEFEADNLTIHGLEPSAEPPLAHVAKLRVRAHIVSLLTKRVDLTYLGIDSPQIYLIVDRDGKSNLPEPKEKSTTSPVQRLFDLAIARAEVRDGILQINDRQIPFDFLANDVMADASFNRPDRRYDATLSVGKIAAKYQNYREVPAASQAEFSVWQNHAQIKRLTLRSQNSSLELSGTVNNFTNPETRIDYSAQVDLPQAAAIARVSGVRKGTATLSGSAMYSAAQYSASGKFALRNVDYAVDAAQLRDASLGGNFQANDAGFRLTDLAGRLFGGEVQGTVDVRNGKQPSGQAQLKLAGLSVEEVARALSTRTMPMEKMKLAGAAGGVLDLTWKDTPARGVADFALDITPPAQPARGQLPLSGTVRGSYELNAGILELHPLQLATNATQIQASGRVGSRTASLNVSLQTSNLGEIDNVLVALGQTRVPAELAGEASFQGMIDGSLRAPEIAGHLQASQFTYHYMPAATTVNTSQPREIHIDSFAGDVLYSSTNVALHHAVISSSGTTLDLDGSASLENGSFVDDSTFQLHAAIQRGDVSALQQIAGTNYPVTGEANLTVQASGTKAKPHGHGSFTLAKATAYGQPIESLTADASLQNSELQITDVVLKAPGGTLSGTGSYNLSTHQMAASLHSNDVQLAKVPELQLARLTTAGTASLQAQASGTPQNPVIDAHLRINQLVLNEEYVGDLHLDAVTHGQEMVITGRSNFRSAVLTLDGTVGMYGNLPGILDVQFKDLDIDPFLGEELKGRITSHSGMAGKVHVSGPLREPRQLTGALTIDDFHVGMENVSVQNDGPIEVTLANQTLTVKRFAMTSADTRLNVVGSVAIGGDKRLQLRADGSVNIALLQTWNPDLTSSGKALLDVRMEGTTTAPVITGTVQIANVVLSDIDLPAALSDLNGKLVFNQSRLEIEKLTGRVGGGSVEFAGYIGYANGVAFNVTSRGRDIRFRYSGISITANQQLKLQGTLKNATVSGDITIIRFAQIPTADLAAAFANTSAPVPNAASPLNNLHFDIHVRSAPELMVQTSVAKLAGDADLRLKGTALNPILLGRVNIAQGDIKINGQKYFLERGDLTFANPVRIDPIIDVEAKTRVRDFDITIGLHGTLERLSTSYRSDPPLSSEDIISLLTLGRTQQEYSLSSSTSGAGFGEATGNAVIGAAINQLVSNRVSKLFGVSAIRINPAVGGGPDNNPNARLTVEQQVSSNVTITYITNLARSAQQVLEFEYNVSRDYTINATRDENGVVSFDLLIRKRKK
jgi:translocation and assembly module TamB